MLLKYVFQKETIILSLSNGQAIFDKYLYIYISIQTLNLMASDFKLNGIQV